MGFIGGSRFTVVTLLLMHTAFAITDFPTASLTSTTSSSFPTLTQSIHRFNNTLSNSTNGTAISPSPTNTSSTSCPSFPPPDCLLGSDFWPASVGFIAAGFLACYLLMCIGKRCTEADRIVRENREQCELNRLYEDYGVPEEERIQLPTGEPWASGRWWFGNLFWDVRNGEEDARAREQREQEQAQMREVRGERLAEPFSPDDIGREVVDQLLHESMSQYPLARVAERPRDQRQEVNTSQESIIDIPTPEQSRLPVIPETYTNFESTNHIPAYIDARQRDKRITSNAFRRPYPPSEPADEQQVAQNTPPSQLSQKGDAGRRLQVAQNNNSSSYYRDPSIASAAPHRTLDTSTRTRTQSLNDLAASSPHLNAPPAGCACPPCTHVDASGQHITAAQAREQQSQQRLHAEAQPAARRKRPGNHVSFALAPEISTSDHHDHNQQRHHTFPSPSAPAAISAPTPRRKNISSLHSQQHQETSGNMNMTIGYLAPTPDMHRVRLARRLDGRPTPPGTMCKSTTYNRTKGEGNG